LTEVARLTLAIGLMGVALRLPPRYFRKRWRSLLMMLGPVMGLMWLVSGLLSWALLGVGIWTAFVIGACVTPTDPVLASATVSGQFARRNLPGRVRHLISGESGANDGLALPLLMLPILIMQRPPDAALGEWLAHSVVWQVGAAVALGWIAGLVAGYVLHWVETHEPISKTSMLSYTLALSLVVLGAGRMLGLDGILAVFVAGRGFTATATNRERREEENVQEAVNQFFILPVFVLLGMTLPWAEWGALGWRGVALAAAILLLRRLPAVMGLHRWIPALRQRGNALFAGWFGPIGVAALLYATHAAAQTGAREVWPAVSLVIVSSILAHGISGAPAIRRMGRRQRSAG
ncbi:MAG: cation:proton antiporter, partial [Phycisphaeraceae bacterium]